jgi:hypothetical protein
VAEIRLWAAAVHTTVAAVTAHIAGSAAGVAAERVRVRIAEAAVRTATLIAGAVVVGAAGIGGDAGVATNLLIRRATEPGGDVINTARAAGAVDTDRSVVAGGTAGVYIDALAVAPFFVVRARCLDIAVQPLALIVRHTAAVAITEDAADATVIADLGLTGTNYVATTRLPYRPHRGSSAQRGQRSGGASREPFQHTPARDAAGKLPGKLVESLTVHLDSFPSLPTTRRGPPRNRSILDHIAQARVEKATWHFGQGPVAAQRGENDYVTPGVDGLRVRTGRSRTRTQT